VCVRSKLQPILETNKIVNFIFLVASGYFGALKLSFGPYADIFGTVDDRRLFFIDINWILAIN
jgi:hypothetical protein